MVPPDRSTIVARINEAWTEVLPSTIVAGFRRTRLLRTDTSSQDAADLEDNDEESFDTIARQLELTRIFGRNLDTITEICSRANAIVCADGQHAHEIVC
ncbi:hypothetical protein DYB26_010629 [Aphanomyces astaci]|uniref:Uncharacterized protein n=1 Tax=Aphanomyces astaci TaxID=112090 RepID=A0A3R6XS37_APHAT|nr:hypothetical protein DYB26_010629 [Aphanomyces astaci]